ncbi:hypothetical protein ABKN59_006724 [Abortiporus biennis]
MFGFAQLSLATSVALASSVFSAPTAVNLTCGGLSNALDTYSNFTLTALYKNIPNDNSTGIPLVVGFAGVSGGAELRVFSTYSSYPYLDWTALEMVNGGLVATGPHVNPATSRPILAGSEPHLLVTNPETPATEEVYCGFASTSAHGSENSQYPRLAIGTDADSFSLCPDGIEDC